MTTYVYTAGMTTTRYQTRRTSLYLAHVPAPARSALNPTRSAVLDAVRERATAKGHIVQDSTLTESGVSVGIRFTSDEEAVTVFTGLLAGLAFYGFTVVTGLGIHRREVSA